MHQTVCTKMLTAALFVIIPNLRQAKCLSKVEWTYLYGRLLQQNIIQQWQTLPCNTMDESYRHNIEQKKRDTKKYLYMIPYI